MVVWTKEYGYVLSWQDMCENDPDSGYVGVGRPACGDCSFGSGNKSDRGGFQWCDEKDELVIRYEKPCGSFSLSPRYPVTIDHVPENVARRQKPRQRTLI